MKVLYTKNNNHFMFYSYNKFLVSILLYLLEKNPEATTTVYPFHLILYKLPRFKSLKTLLIHQLTNK